MYIQGGLWQTIVHLFPNNIGIGRNNNSDNCSICLAGVGKQIALVYYAQEFFPPYFFTHSIFNYYIFPYIYIYFGWNRTREIACE